MDRGIFMGTIYAREGLNQLRMSLHRSLMLPHMECDSEKEINVDENDVNELHEQLDKMFWKNSLRKEMETL